MEERVNPYRMCPTFETERFILRMVEENDAEALLHCYSDSKSAQLFNSDNCMNDFVYQSVDEIKNCIRFWIDEYKRQYYIRFSIVSKLRINVIGTIEIFAKQETFQHVGKVGVLRIDLASEYETVENIEKLLEIIDDNFFETFEINGIITKAIPQAKDRIAALVKRNYNKLKGKEITPYDSYYIKIKT